MKTRFGLFGWESKMVVHSFLATDAGLIYDIDLAICEVFDGPERQHGFAGTELLLLGRLQLLLDLPSIVSAIMKHGL